METILTVLKEFGTFPALIDAELERQLPFLATTKILMAAVKAGVGREVAHEVIKEHAVLTLTLFCISPVPGVTMLLCVVAVAI